jgi:hypothetical protein
MKGGLALSFSHYLGHLGRWTQLLSLFSIDRKMIILLPEETQNKKTTRLTPFFCSSIYYEVSSFFASSA